MKKLILVLVILLTVPVFALNITLVQQSPDGNKVNLNYADACSTNLPRAFALKVEVNSPAKIVDVVNFKIGESNSVNPGYGIYPARIDINSTTGDVNSWGSPLAEPTDPGPGTGLGTNKIVLEFGSLYVGDGNGPATSGTLCTLKMDCNGATGNVNIVATEEDQYRGGVVLEDGAAPDPNLTASLVYACAPPPCYAGKADYSTWESLGSPSCWCFPRQCHGDGTGSTEGGGKLPVIWVGGNDLTVLGNSWKKNVGASGFNPCADYDHKTEGGGKLPVYRVGGNDLTVLGIYWKDTSNGGPYPEPNCLNLSQTP